MVEEMLAADVKVAPKAMEEGSAAALGARAVEVGLEKETLAGMVGTMVVKWVGAVEEVVAEVVARVRGSHMYVDCPRQRDTTRSAACTARL